MAIEKVALDRTDDPRVRNSALWPTLTKFDHARAVDIGIACLWDKAPEPRLAAYWLLGNIGGDKAVAALEKRFFTAPEKNCVVDALGHTRDPAAIKFLLKHTRIADLRGDKEWRDAFVRAMIAMPLAEAQPIMVALMREGNAYERKVALPYFQKFPCPEVSPYVITVFEDVYPYTSLKGYAQLWAFSNIAQFTPEVRERLKACVRGLYPEAVFDAATDDPLLVDDQTLAEVIDATFSPKPAGIYRAEMGIVELVVNGRAPSAEILAYLNRAAPSVQPRSRYNIEPRICAVHGVKRIAPDQILLKETFVDSEWAFLAVRKDDRWVIAERQRLRILCW